jgi:hypothetical protein
MLRRQLAVAWFTLALADVSAAAAQRAAPNTLTAAEKAAGWRLLFDGKTLTGWHGLGYKTGDVGLWRVEDGALARIPVGRAPVQGDGQPLTGVDLISNESYRDFELAWEWKVASGGNSGLKYNVSESLSTEMAPPHAAKGWEYQMLDDSLAEDNKLPSHRAGRALRHVSSLQRDGREAGRPVEFVAPRIRGQPRRALA